MLVLRAVVTILWLMWFGLLFAPAGLRDVVGLVGVGALVAVLAVDWVRDWRTVRRGQARRR
jgi:hypothetical protein